MSQWGQTLTYQKKKKKKKLILFGLHFEAPHDACGLNWIDTTHITN